MVQYGVGELLEVRPMGLLSRLTRLNVVSQPLSVSLAGAVRPPSSARPPRTPLTLRLTALVLHLLAQRPHHSRPAARPVPPPPRCLFPFALARQPSDPDGLRVAQLGRIKYRHVGVDGFVDRRNW